MINDAIVQVECDRKGCNESIDINPEYKYRDWSGKSGFYDTSDEAIEKKLEHEGWFVANGKHYCSAECERMAQ